MFEFNSLANMIAPSGDTQDDFKLNLFPEASGGAGQSGISSGQDNIINIDLGKQGKSEALKKVIKDFEDIDLKAGAEKNTGDELLDLMDDY